MTPVHLLRQHGLLGMASAVLMGLSACSTPQALHPIDHGSLTETHAPPIWSGRLSLHVNSQPPSGWQASFELSGSATDGELKLLSPLGSVVAKADWDQASATLWRGDTRYDYPNLDSLGTAITGTTLPIAALFDWLQGQATLPDGWSVELQAQQGRIVAQRHQPQPSATLRIALEQP